MLVDWDEGRTDIWTAQPPPLALWSEARNRAVSTVLYSYTPMPFGISGRVRVLWKLAGTLCRAELHRHVADGRIRTGDLSLVELRGIEPRSYVALQLFFYVRSPTVCCRVRWDAPRYVVPVSIPALHLTFAI